MKKILLVLVVLLASCTSAKKKKQIDEFKDADFKQTKKKKYSQQSDFHKVKKDKDERFGLLSKETLSRLSDDARQAVEEKGDDISKILAKCYRGNFEEAFSDVNSSGDTLTKFPSYWNSIGICFLLKNEDKKAVLFFNKAKSIKRKYAPAFNNLGVVFRSKGEDGKAIAAFNKAMDLNQFSFTPKFNLAQIYLEYGLIDKAEKYFKVLYHNDPQDYDVIIGLATSYLFKGKYSKSLKLFNELESDYFETPAIGLNYSLALFHSGNKDAAHDIFSDIKIKKASLKYKEYHQQIKSIIGYRK
jgi:tetratricopeptide (TPR) repeat protein